MGHLDFTEGNSGSATLMRRRQPYRRGKFEEILLSLAAENEHDRVAKIVFGRDHVNLDKLDKLGQIYSVVSL